MRYALAFLLAVVGLTAAAVATFVHISSVSIVAAAPGAGPVADTVPRAEVRTPAVPTAADYARYAEADRLWREPVPTAADYARYAEADRLWRERNARPYTIAELRARGDGRRTPREAMQDRVFELTRRGDRSGAIVELERWVRGHSRDEQSLLSLARLLNEVGRTSDAVSRYREILALHNRAN